MYYKTVGHRVNLAEDGCVYPQQIAELVKDEGNNGCRIALGHQGHSQVVERRHLGSLSLLSLVGAGALDGHGCHVGQSGKKLLVGRVESIHLATLSVQHADDLVVYLEGDTKLGAGLKLAPGYVAGVLSHVRVVDRFAQASSLDSDTFVSAQRQLQ